jgi:hypothetical protein
MNRVTQLARVLAVALALGAPATPYARVDVDIDIAPPPPRYEAVPPPRVGYVWTPGYWYWDAEHRHHIWHKGYFVREHPGEHWVPHHWTEHDGHYRYSDGHWEGGA